MHSLRGSLDFMLNGRDDLRACWGDNPNGVDGRVGDTAAGLAGAATMSGY